MAGGQERILRQRIRSINGHQEDHARHGADRRRPASCGPSSGSTPPQPYSDQITEVVKDLAAAGGEVAEPAPRRPARDPPGLPRRDRRRPRPVRAPTTPSVIRAAEGEIKNDALRGIGYSLVARRPQGRVATTGSAATTSTPCSPASPRRPTYEDARAIGQTVVDLYLAGEVDSVELVYTRFVSAGFQEVVLRPLVPLEHELLAGRRRQAAGDGPSADYEFEPSPGDDPRGAAAPLRRGPHLRRPAQRRRLAAGRPPAGHEGGHRQRRRAHQELHAGHEPGPPGHHHHRDHGDRRWRRGAVRRQEARRPTDRPLETPRGPRSAAP